MVNNFIVYNLKDELYFDPINHVIFCRKYKFKRYSIVSIASFIDDTMTSILLYEINTSYLKNFIRINYNQLEIYSFLDYSELTQSYKITKQFLYSDIPINYKYLKNYNYKKDVNVYDDKLIGEYKIKDHYYRIEKLNRILK